MRTKESMMAVNVCSSASAMLTILTTLKPNSIAEKKLRASAGDPLPADVLRVVCAVCEAPVCLQAVVVEIGWEGIRTGRI